MSKNYTQLCYEQRYQIEALLKVGLKKKEIALHVGVSPSTISRELKRNTANRGRTSEYCPEKLYMKNKLGFPS